MSDASGQFSGLNPNAQIVFNQTMPVPNVVKSMPIPITLAAETFATLNLSVSQSRGVIDKVQSVYIDNSLGAGQLQVTCNQTGQSVNCPPYSQGFFPLVVPNPPAFTFTAIGGDVAGVIQLMNVPMPLATWRVGGDIDPVAPAIKQLGFTIATATVFQNVLPANPDRKGGSVQYNGAGLGYVWFGDGATFGDVTKCLILAPGKLCDLTLGQPNGVWRGIVSLSSNTNSDPFFVMEV